MAENEDKYSHKLLLKRKKIVNLFSYLCISAMVISVLPDIYFGLYINASKTLLATLPFLVILFINAKFTTDIAASIFIIDISISAFIFSIALGKEANVQLFFMFVLLAVPFVIDIKNIKTIIFHLIHPILFFLILEITNYHISFIPQFTGITAEQKEFFGVFNLSILFVFIPIIVFAIIYDNLNSEKELRSIASKLTSQNEELLNKNKQLDAFAYSVSHDLRSPIASVLGLIDISKYETDVNMLKEYNLLKEKSLKKLDEFINEILQHTRNNRTELSVQEINLEELISSLIEQHAHLPGGETIKTIINIEQTDKFYSDNNRLTIIFSNLIANSFKYHDTNKTDKFIELKGLINKNQAILVLKDNGTGIEDEHLPKLFDMFYRANSVIKGSGLGLYLVKECIEKISGNISIRSVKNEFTEFTLELPQLKQNDIN